MMFKGFLIKDGDDRRDIGWLNKHIFVASPPLNYCTPWVSQKKSFLPGSVRGHFYHMGGPKLFFFKTLYWLRVECLSNFYITRIKITGIGCWRVNLASRSVDFLMMLWKWNILQSPKITIFIIPLPLLLLLGSWKRVMVVFGRCPF